MKRKSFPDKVNRLTLMEKRIRLASDVSYAAWDTKKEWELLIGFWDKSVVILKFSMKQKLFFRYQDKVCICSKGLNYYTCRLKWIYYLEVLLKQNEMNQNKEFWTQKREGIGKPYRYHGFDFRLLNKVSIWINQVAVILLVKGRAFTM